jgi:hypothetical protein
MFFYYYSSPSTTRRTNPATAPPAMTRSSFGLTTWSSNGVQYKIGDMVFYDGTRYLCVHAHTSFPGAEPSLITWALWQHLE